MAFNPKPQVWIAGEYVPTSAAGDPTHIGLEGLKIEWGSHERFVDIIPATLTFTILDPTGEWIADKVLSGTDIKVAYTWWDGSKWDNRYMFRGMITAANITPRKLEKEANEDHGYYVDIVATDRIGQLGNTYVSFDASATNERRTLRYRADKINEAAGNTFSGIVTANEPVYGMIPEVYTNSAALTVLDDLYRGAQYARPEYDPHTNRIERGRWETITYWNFAAFCKDEDSGKYMLGMPRHPNVFDDSKRGINLIYTLPAEDVESDGVLTQDVDSSITNISIKYYKSTQGAEKEFYSRIAVNIPNYKGIGNRTWNFETKFYDYDAAPLLALESEAKYNLWRWRLEDVKWTTKRTGGFKTTTHMHMWLQPRSNDMRIFLNGSAHGHLKDYVPIYSLLGNTITYRDDAWHFEPKLAPYGYDTAMLEPITFTRWGTGTTNNPQFSELHESIRLSDMKYTEDTIREPLIEFGNAPV